ncbi:MAG: hypothetical protein IPI82_18110 [Candidatus Microthrix sp.]|nr:hypothetical protein [Candidatus Microthrix sp.]MBK7324280.1 hypothetical protein [Candidatus Microthrix sp.]
MLSCGEVITALTATGCGPPLYDVAGWATSAAIHERLRDPRDAPQRRPARTALEQFTPISDTVRSELMLKAIDRFGIDAGRLPFGPTCIPVSGAFEDPR